MKYCPECGKPLEIKTDFFRTSFTDSIKLIKRCKYCKNVVDTVDVRVK